jgi:hypothetical protein
MRESMVDVIRCTRPTRQVCKLAISVMLLYTPQIEIYICSKCS